MLPKDAQGEVATKIRDRMPSPARVNVNALALTALGFSSCLST